MKLDPVQQLERLERDVRMLRVRSRVTLIAVAGVAVMFGHAYSSRTSHLAHTIYTNPNVLELERTQEMTDCHPVRRGGMEIISRGCATEVGGVDRQWRVKTVDGRYVGLNITVHEDVPGRFPEPPVRVVPDDGLTFRKLPTPVAGQVLTVGRSGTVEWQTPR